VEVTCLSQFIRFLFLGLDSAILSFALFNDSSHCLDKHFSGEREHHALNSAYQESSGFSGKTPSISEILDDTRSLVVYKSSKPKFIQLQDRGHQVPEISSVSGSLFQVIPREISSKVPCARMMNV
jgi:hypothetical protein